MPHRLRSALTLATLAACAGCAGPIMSDEARAVANLAPTTGSKVSGTVNFVQSADKVLVRGQIRGLKPNAQHGFHVHEKGDCSSGDGMSTGGHFNPTGRAHGNHDAGEHHTGDLPMVKANADGVATLNFQSATIRVGSGITDIVGKGLIVHRDPDDFKTQPTGNSGPRLACAVIVKS
jgi:Cu-Zn family superoxide dismutase